MLCTWTIINIYYNKLQKKLFSKIHSFEKKNWEKKHAIIFISNHVYSLYCTHMSN
jgi:hypothetical protein